MTAPASYTVKMEARIKGMTLAKWLVKPALLVLRGRAAMWWTNLALRVVRVEYRTGNGPWERIRDRMVYATADDMLRPKP